MRMFIIMCAAFTITASFAGHISKSDELSDSALITMGYHNDNDESLITKAKNSQQKIEKVDLENGLRLHVVHDSSVDDTSVSISVNAGNYDDPEAVPGLAHYLSHVIVRSSTEKGATTSLYDLIRDSYGQMSTVVNNEQSTFAFTINSELFSNILPVFAQLYCQPDFTNHASTKAKAILEDEWQTKKQSLPFILSRVNAMTSNPAHPIHHLNQGNAEIIERFDKTELSQHLQFFYQQHYVAKNTHVAVVSNLPVSQVVSLITNSFSSLSKSKVPQHVTLPPVFLSSHKAIELNVSTQHDETMLMLQFPIAMKQYPSNYNAHEYIEFLFSLHQPETLTTQLVSQGLIYYMLPLISPESYGESGTATFVFSLTEKGSEHTKNIVTAFMRYISIIEESGLNDTNIQAFRQYKKTQTSALYYDSPQQVAYFLSGTNLPISTYLAPPHFDTTQLDKKDFIALLSQLTLTNLRLWQINNNHPTTKQVDFADATFSVSSLPIEDFQVDNNRFFTLSFPNLGMQELEPNKLKLSEAELNETTPSPYSIKGKESVKVNLNKAIASQNESPIVAQVTKVYQEPGITAWHANSQYTLQSQVFVGLKIRHLDHVLTRNSSILMKLMSAAFSRVIFQLRNTAQLQDNLSLLSGLNKEELFISLSGASARHSVYVEHIVAHFQSFIPTEQCFNHAKETLKHSYINITNTSPVSQAQYYTQAIAMNSASPIDINETLDVLDKISLAELQAFIKAYKAQVAFELLVFGTSTPQNTKQLAMSIKQQLNIQNTYTPANAQPRKSFLPSYNSFVKRHHQQLTTINTTYLIEHPSAVTIAHHLVLKILLQHSKLQREFAEKNEKCRLMCTHQMLNGYSGITISVENTYSSLQQLTSQLSNWLSIAKQYITQLSQFDIEKAKYAIQRRLLIPPNSFYKEASPIIADWLNNEIHFDTKSKVAKAVNSIVQTSLSRSLAQLSDTNAVKKIQVSLKGIVR